MTGTHDAPVTATNWETSASMSAFAFPLSFDDCGVGAGPRRERAAGVRDNINSASEVVWAEKEAREYIK